jgi:c-di-AMP phosphodiesterase-like protein
VINDVKGKDLFSMNKKQRTALGINFLGLLLFVVWLVVRSSLSNVLSIAFAIVFLSLLAVSFVLLIRAIKSANDETER